MGNGLGGLLRDLLGNLPALDLDALCRNGLPLGGLRDRLPERRLPGKPLRGDCLGRYGLSDLRDLGRRNGLRGSRLSGDPARGTVPGATGVAVGWSGAWRARRRPVGAEVGCGWGGVWSASGSCVSPS